MEKTKCSETSAHKIQTPGNHPKEKIQHSQHGKSLKSITSIPASSYNLTKAAKILEYSTWWWLSKTRSTLWTNEQRQRTAIIPCWSRGAFKPCPFPILCPERIESLHLLQNRPTPLWRTLPKNKSCPGSDRQHPGALWRNVYCNKGCTLPATKCSHISITHITRCSWFFKCFPLSECFVLLFFDHFMVRRPLVGPVLVNFEVSRSHSDIPNCTTPLDEYSARRITSTWQHTTLTRDWHPCPRRDSN